MDLNTPPKIVTTVPKNYAVDIETDALTITIGFNIDLDSRHIGNNLRLQAKDERPVSIRSKYEYRTIKVTTTKPLDPNTTYQLTVYGDSNLDNTEITGIRSALGISMQGNAVLNFTTMSVLSVRPPAGYYPVDQGVIQSVPEFKWEAHPANDETVYTFHYEIQVSQSNLMEPIHWGNHSVQSPVVPSISFPDGMYYWRIRTIGKKKPKIEIIMETVDKVKDGRVVQVVEAVEHWVYDKNDYVSDWSPIYTFNLDTVQESPVVNEDTLPPEIGYDPIADLSDKYVEFLESFPGEDFSNVDTKLKTVYFKVLGEVDPEDVSIEMIGESVMGDETDHGTVSGTVEVVSQGDGVTILAFTPVVLQNG